jgi:fido (protein-threonine AMPylation protein)
MTFSRTSLKKGKIKWMEKIFQNYLYPFLAGLITSGIISYIFYAKQRRKDEKEQREFVLVLHSLWQQGVYLKAATNTISTKIDEINKKPDSLSKLGLLDSEYKYLNNVLWEAFRKKEKGEYIEAALEYKEIADARAETAISQLKFIILKNDGSINLERIQQAHLEMFPKGYAWGGSLRHQMISIFGTIKTAGRIINPTVSSYNTQLVPPEEISDKITKLIKRWNDNVTHLQADDIKALAEELANFHHDFLLIHPFLDGNGRISRIILNEQASFFLKRPIIFKFDREEYFESLHLADMRNMSQLAEIIRVQMKAKNE